MPEKTNDLVKNLELAFQAVGSDVKKLLAQDGNLETLTTTQKASLVVAINEVNAAVKAIDVKSIINDSSSDATHAWSAQKVAAEILTKTNAVKDALLGGAGEAFDTLKELADLINTNKGAIEALKTIAGNYVRFDQAQQLTPVQKKQALDNIGGASAESLAQTEKKAAANATAIGTLTSLKTTEKTNLVGAINEVKTQAEQGATNASAADKKASKAQGDVDALKTAIGDTTKDFAQVYTTARNGAPAA